MFEYLAAGGGIVLVGHATFGIMTYLEKLCCWGQTLKAYLSLVLLKLFDFSYAQI